MERLKYLTVKSKPMALNLKYECCDYAISSKQGDATCFEEDYHCIMDYQNSVFKMYFILFCTLICLSVGLLLYCLTQAGIRRSQRRQLQNAALKRLETNLE